jgi:hypothetical protein
VPTRKWPNPNSTPPAIVTSNPSQVTRIGPDARRSTDDPTERAAHLPGACLARWMPDLGPPLLRSFRLPACAYPCATRAFVLPALPCGRGPSTNSARLVLVGRDTAVDELGDEPRARRIERLVTALRTAGAGSLRTGDDERPFARPCPGAGPRESRPRFPRVGAASSAATGATLRQGESQERPGVARAMRRLVHDERLGPGQSP